MLAIAIRTGGPRRPQPHRVLKVCFGPILLQQTGCYISQLANSYISNSQLLQIIDEFTEVQQQLQIVCELQPIVHNCINRDINTIIICEQVQLLIAFCHLFSQPHYTQDVVSAVNSCRILFQYRQKGQGSSRIFQVAIYVYNMQLQCFYTRHYNQVLVMNQPYLQLLLLLSQRQL